MKREILGIRIIKGSLFAAFIHKYLNTVYKKTSNLSLAAGVPTFNLAL